MTQKQEDSCGLEVREQFGHRDARAPPALEEHAWCENPAATSKGGAQLSSLTSRVPPLMPPEMRELAREPCGRWKSPMS